VKESGIAHLSKDVDQNEFSFSNRDFIDFSFKQLDLYIKTIALKTIPSHSKATTRSYFACIDRLISP
ncbi:unnamed protein product, partial [Acidithrix sp. C25]